MRTISVLIAAALLAGVLTSCGVNTGSSSCLCVTRHASGEKGEVLDSWVNFGIPEAGAPSGYVDEVAVAELTFLSIRGDQGIQVFVCNQHRLLTSIEIDDQGPELFSVPPGCTIQIRCARREGQSGGCETEYRFRWLH